MKKYQNKFIALSLLAAFAISSCSVEYRERRHHRPPPPPPPTRVIITN